MNARLKILAVITAFSVVLVSLIASYLFLQLEKPINTGASSSYEVKKGATIGSVAVALEKLHVLPIHSRLFRYYGLLTRGEGEIKAGEYELPFGISSRELLQLFRSGRVIQKQITFPEGWNFSQWRKHLEDREDIAQTIQTSSDSDVMKLLGEPGVSAEGRFFPDTYHYLKDEADIEILRRAHVKLRSVLEEEWRSRTIGDELKTQEEALILASIVEKETGYGPDRMNVARVFLNRLVKGMRLQSDPTVIYGLGERFDGDLRRSHLREEQPFNTYMNKGLTPTPISMPGRAAIHAALHAGPGNYLYFVAKGDGSSHFSLTLPEHNAAVNQYQKSLKKVR